MTSDVELDRLLTAWLSADAPAREPEHLLGEVLDRTARTRRRSAWQVPERWIPMSSISVRLQPFARVTLRSVAVVALLILALAIGAVLIAGSRARTLPAPFGPAANGGVAYSINGDILAIDSPGATPRILIGGPTTDSVPIFAPDGAHLLFIRGNPAGEAEIWAAEPDGANPIRLAAVSKVGWLEWSPQSDEIAVSNEIDPTTITLVRADGSGSTVLSTGLQTVESQVWRPLDGRQLTFRGQDAAGTWGIYLIDRDGSNMVRLELDPGFENDEFYAVNSEYYFQAPAWSPDGTRLAYHTLEPDPTSPAGPGFRIHVAIMGDGATVIEDKKLELNRQADDEWVATWLPTSDGLWYTELEGATKRLLRADLAGSGPGRDPGVVVTGDLSYQLSPDGRQMIAALRPEGSVTTIQAIDLESGTVTPLAIGDDFFWQRVAP